MDKCSCGSDVWSIKWAECKRCYFRRYQNERRLGQSRKRPQELTRRSCGPCGGVFESADHTRRFCSRSCASRNAAAMRWDDADARAAHARMMAERRWGDTRKCGCGHVVPRYEGHYLQKCDECAGIVCRAEGCGATVDRNKRWCDTHRAERRRLTPRENLARTCSAEDCERPTAARGLCSMHWKRVRATELPKKPVPFDGARMQRHYERRTWVKAGERVTIAGLRERDGDACGICGEQIDFELSGRNPRGRSVDHIMPRSRGGAHTWANTQLAHLRCNLSKGAKVPESVSA